MNGSMIEHNGLGISFFNVDSWTAPVVSDKPWSVNVGGEGVKTLPFCVGTAYNVSSMEDIGNSWSLC